MSWTLQCQLMAFVGYFLYASFFEWAFHKYLFHSPKYIKATFRAHTLIHHQRYKFAPSSYEWQQGQEKDHIAMDWFALPLFVGFHLPFFWIIERVTGIPSIWGGLGAVVAYYAIYEYFHYCMHVPNNRFFEKNGVFRFVKEHHRIHHKYMLKNLNVFFPLADLCLGTFISQKAMAARQNVTNTPVFHESEEQAAPPPAPAAAPAKPIRQTAKKSRETAGKR